MQNSPANAMLAEPSCDLAESPLKLARYEQHLRAGMDGPASPSPNGPVEKPSRMQRTQNEITQLRKRKARGETLTTEEQAQLSAYYARYSRRKQGVHLKGKREEQWRALADAQGIGLGPWIQERVDMSLRGNDEAMREVRDENQRLRDEVAGLRGTSGNLAVENSRMQARIEVMEGRLLEAMDQALQIQEAVNELRPGGESR